MDLDNFLKDYQAFKARVQPMLEEYERYQKQKDEYRNHPRSEEEKAEAERLDAAIYAPLTPGTPFDLSNQPQDPESPPQESPPQETTPQPTPEEVAAAEAAAKLHEEIHKTLPPTAPVA